MSAPEVTTHVSAPATGPLAAAALQLQHGLGHRVHPVQVALGEQAAVRVHRKRAPARTNSPPPPRSASPRPSRPMSTVLVKQS